MLESTLGDWTVLLSIVQTSHQYISHLEGSTLDVQDVWCKLLCMLISTRFVVLWVKIVSVYISKMDGMYGQWLFCLDGGWCVSSQLRDKSLGVLCHVPGIATLHSYTSCSERDWLWCPHLGTAVIVLHWLHLCWCQNYDTLTFFLTQHLHGNVANGFFPFFKGLLGLSIRNTLPWTHILGTWLTAVVGHLEWLTYYSLWISWQGDIWRVQYELFVIADSTMKTRNRFAVLDPRPLCYYLCLSIHRMYFLLADKKIGK